MDTPKKTAHTAGALYFILVVTGIFSLAYVPNQLIDWKDPALTLSNIVARESLFRWGIVAGIICYTAYLLLPLVLYKLFQHINRNYATAMVGLALVSVPISLYNLSNKIAVLTLISDAEFLQTLDTAQLQLQVMLCLEHYDNGIQIASFFWGMWLLPFGYLVFKSGMLPKFLGIFLMAGCFGYLINFTGGFLFEGSYRALGISKFVSMPATIGEIGTCLWLLIAGVRSK